MVQFPVQRDTVYHLQAPFVPLQKFNSSVFPLQLAANHQPHRVEVRRVSERRVAGQPEAEPRLARALLPLLHLAQRPRVRPLYYRSLGMSTCALFSLNEHRYVHSIIAQWTRGHAVCYHSLGTYVRSIIAH